MQNSEKFLYRIACRFLDTEQFVELPDHDKNGQTCHKPIQYRFGEKLGDETKARQAGSQKNRTDNQGERNGILLVDSWIKIRPAGNDAGRDHDRGYR